LSYLLINSYINYTKQCLGYQARGLASTPAVRDPLLVSYNRRPPRGGGIEVFGDAALLGSRLERVSLE
jgi:hypothetical protein